MFRRRGFWLVLLLVLLVGGGGYYYYTTTLAASEEAPEEAPIQTTAVRRGDLTISATGAGTIIPASEIAIGFGSGGTLTELLVRVGDEVQAGDVLARLDDTAAQEAIAAAQLQLTQATMQTDASATEVGVSYDDISVQQAQLNLEVAQAALTELLDWEPDADEIALAEANLATAQASVQAASGQSAASSYSLQVSGINLEQAQRGLADAEEAYTTAFDPGRDWERNIDTERANAENGLIRAQDSLAIAQANYNAAASSTASSNVTSAEGNVLNAELALKAAQTGPTDEAIAQAETAVRQAELSLLQAQLNKESNQINLQQAQMGVTTAEAALDELVLMAPSAGTITAVSASAGETVSGAFISIADLERPLIEVFLDESDLDKAGLDFEADVIFDALPDETFVGQIVQVDPMLTTEAGVTAVRAVVQLDEASFTKPQTLPIGLNATVEIIGGRATNALLVPVEALREISPGEFAVFVLENDEPTLRFVEVGLMDFTFAEIISGVEAGETVTTGLIQTQ